MKYKKSEGTLKDLLKPTPICLSCLTYQKYIEHKKLTNDFIDWQNTEREKFIQDCLKVIRKRTFWYNIIKDKS